MNQVDQTSAFINPQTTAPLLQSSQRAEQHLFSGLDTKGLGMISRSTLIQRFTDMGILTTDPRLKEALATLPEDKEQLSFQDFLDFARRRPRLVRKVLQGQMAVPDFSEFCTKITEIFEGLKTNSEGELATYIPQLAKINPDHFAISLCTVDGQQFNIGDSDHYFCAQSTCKPVNYCLALQEYGEEEVHRYIGHEPSGKGFNELTLNSSGLPHNPMINAGAILNCALLKPELKLAERFEYVTQMWGRLSGGQRPRFDNSVYLSEKESADRNFALGYFMREQGAFPLETNLKETLDFYFQCCSIELNANMMAKTAATLAAAGICPTTEERVLRPSVVKNCLSLMSSCGMYDYSGGFSFEVGLPAKSGVSGAVMVVIPNLMGICIWSPRLDPLGNSVRGTAFCKELVSYYNFHAYDSLILNHSHKVDPRLKQFRQQSATISDLLWATHQGDLSAVQQMASEGIDINAANYDGRTALHLAACEGHLHLVDYLIVLGADINQADRWGHTALDCAEQSQHLAIANVLMRHGGSRGHIFPSEYLVTPQEFDQAVNCDLTDLDHNPQVLG